MAKRGLIPCDAEIEKIKIIVNKFYSPDDWPDAMVVSNPYKSGKSYLYSKVRHPREKYMTDWGEILFPIKRKSEDPFIIVFSAWLLTEKFRITTGRRNPKELCGSLNVALEIPAGWDKRNVRAVFGWKGDMIDGELVKSQIDIILNARRFGASGFQMIDDYGMISFDPSCYGLNIEKLWECANLLSS